MKRNLLAKFSLLTVILTLFITLCCSVKTATKEDIAQKQINEIIKNAKSPHAGEKLGDYTFPAYSRTVEGLHDRMDDADKAKKRQECIDVAAYGLNQITNLMSGPENGDVSGHLAECGVALINTVATFFGAGAISEVITSTIMNFGSTPKMSEIQNLQQHLDDQFEETYKRFDSLQRDVANVSNKIDESTEKIIDALYYAINASDAKKQVFDFVSNTSGNFSYKEFKNTLYGENDTSSNPFYYRSAYHDILIDSLGNSTKSDAIIEKNYNNLYMAIESTNQNKSNLSMLYEYILSDKISGKESIAHYYYDYLAANHNSISNVNIVDETLDFALDVYNAAARAENCLNLCNSYIKVKICEKYKDEVNDESTYDFEYGNETISVTYKDIKDNEIASKVRQELLEKQVAQDLAYILGMGESFTTSDAKNGMQIMCNNDGETYGQVKNNQTIYLNILTDKLCGRFALDKEKFEYVWVCDDITKNIGIFDVANNTIGFDTEGEVLTAKVMYEDVVVYSIDFTINDDESYCGGSGTEDDPYLIKNAAQFNLIASNSDGLDLHYKLVDDIDFNNVSRLPIGDEDVPFNGTLDGNGYTLSNLNVQSSTSSGLFGCIGNDGQVKNIVIANSTFTVVGNNEEKLYAGAIAGINEGNIYNCQLNNVTVTAKQDATLKNRSITVYAAGIAGMSRSNSSISYCELINSDITIELKRDYGSEDDVSNAMNAYAGGIVGVMSDNATLSDCVVCSDTNISCFAESYCNDGGFSTRYPYVTVRAGGIAGKAISKAVSKVYSEANIEKCEYYKENVHGIGYSKDNNCSAGKNIYIPEIDNNILTAMKVDKGNIEFPLVNKKYTVTCVLKENCNNNYECGEKNLRINDLIFKIKISNNLYKETKGTVLAYYGFDTHNTSTTAAKYMSVIMLVSCENNGEKFLARCTLNISVEKNSPVKLVMNKIPTTTKYEYGQGLSLAGGEFALIYKDGMEKIANVTTANVEYTTFKYGDSKVIVTYEGCSTSYNINIKCNHGNSEQHVCDPTCTSEGYTEWLCPDCEYSRVESITPKIAHNVVLRYSDIQPCSKNYKGDTYECSVCHKIDHVEYNKVAHTYSLCDEDNNFHECGICHEKDQHQYKSVETDGGCVYTCMHCGYIPDKTPINTSKTAVRVVVSDAYVLEEKEEIAAVYIQLLNNPGITGVRLCVNYDSHLEFLGYERGNVLSRTAQTFSQMSYPEHNRFNFAIGGAAADNTSGTILKLLFKVPKSEKNTQYNISLCFTDSTNAVEFTDANNDLISIITMDGSILIVDHLPGDVNNDNVIDILDAVLIAQYSILNDEDQQTIINEVVRRANNSEITDNDFFNIIYADVIPDRDILLNDAIEILRYIVGGYGAQIISNEYNVILNYNNGQGDFDTIMVKYYNDDFTNGRYLNAEAFNNVKVTEREGYYFDGWYTELPNGSGIKVDENSIITFSNPKSLNRKLQVLYAHYTLNEISFAGNGATSGLKETVKYLGESEEIVLDSNIFQQEISVEFNNNYIDGGTKTENAYLSIAGWTKDVTTNEKAYDYGKIVNIAEANIGKITLSPIWGNATIKPADPTRDNYVFIGWAYESNATEPDFAIGEDIILNKDDVLYACWEGAPRKIYYNENGGICRTPYVIINYGDDAPSLPIAEKDNDYVFAGWFTLAVGGEKVTELNISLLSNESTVYAHWVRAYTITFAQTSGNRHTKKVCEGNPIGDFPPAFGSSPFLGWYCDGQQVDNNTKVYGDMTIYAIFK